jgi:hypothetical protein
MRQIFMRDARYLISLYAQQILSREEVGIRPKDNSITRSHPNGERINHWGLAFCPDQKAVIFRKIIARSRRID